MWGDYFYYSRTMEGKSYRYICRRKGSVEGPEEIILDLNQVRFPWVDTMGLGCLVNSTQTRWHDDINNNHHYNS